MHPLTTKIASLRLSPIQLVFWGHPESTGLSTIDYYLSADLFETLDSQEAYTEKLVKLPNLGCHYSRLHVDPDYKVIDALALNSNIPILICPGVPSKYDPKYDYIFIEIVKKLGMCKLVFFDSQPNITAIFKNRLSTLFENSGIDFKKYVVFSPWLSPNEFYGLLSVAHIFLDTIGFSGFNTAMQSIDCALPVVTIKGKFMRGRLASGILEKMGITELIANSESEYIDIVIRLIRDNQYRIFLREKIINSREILYNDMEAIYAFENFLINAVG